MATVYEINRGINRSIEFKGIKAQYIIYLAIGLLILFIFFAVLYFVGLNIYLCLAIILIGGVLLFTYVQHFSRKYGEHGLLKKSAQRNLPRAVRSKTRTLFIRLNQNIHEKQ